MAQKFPLDCGSGEGEGAVLPFPTPKASGSAPCQWRRVFFIFIPSFSWRGRCFQWAAKQGRQLEAVPTTWPAKAGGMKFLLLSPVKKRHQSSVRLGGCKECGIAGEWNSLLPFLLGRMIGIVQLLNTLPGPQMQAPTRSKCVNVPRSNLGIGTFRFGSHP